MAYKTPVIVLGLLACLAAPAHAIACAPEQYYGPNDLEKTAALASPHADFKRIRALAMEGNAASQRSLGALYESGYLVTACAEKAGYWYEKAANAGDEVAKSWLERNARMTRLREGPECVGCAGALRPSANPVESAHSALLRSGPNGAFRANVTVNGKSVRGMIDTGATYISMSSKTAAELGIEHANGRQVQTQTANGPKTARLVRLAAITVEGITLTNVDAIVGDSDHQLLVGMSFLSRVSMSSSGGAMTLTKR